MRTFSTTLATSLCLTLALAAPATAQIYDSGPLVTNPTGGFAGQPVSELENGGAMLLKAFGFRADRGVNTSIADDFTVCGTWTVTDLEFFAYQVNGTTPTITGVYVRIWDKDPRTFGAVTVYPGGFGDPWSLNLIGGLPVFHSYRAPTNSILSANREVQAIKVPLAITLAPATYWMEVQFSGDISLSGPWIPPVTKLGCRKTGGAILNSTSNVAGTWNLINNSNTIDPAGIALPFRVYGVATGGSTADASTYGAGKLGSNGVGAWDLGSPVHQPVLGSVFPMTLRNGVPGSVPVVLLSASACTFALPCATLFVCPPFVQFTMPPFDSSNTSMGHIEIPHGTTYCGVTVYLQAFWADSGASCNFGHSDGLKITLGD